MRRLVAAGLAVVLAGAFAAGSATATPSRAAVTYTFDFDNQAEPSQFDDGYTSGYWTTVSTVAAHSGTQSVQYKIRSFDSVGRTWIELDTPNDVQSSALPVTISYWLYVPSGAAPAGAEANAWRVAAYAAGVEPHNHAGHAPTAGWSYQDISQTAGTWKKYTFTTSVNTTSDPTVRTAVGIQATWPSTNTYYIDDVTVAIG